MRVARMVLAAAVVAASLAGGFAGVSRNDTANAAVGPVTWSDEFNGAAGTPIDQSKWKFDTGGSGWGNNELEYYTNSTRNVVQDGQGHLAITARNAALCASILGGSSLFGRVGVGWLLDRFFGARGTEGDRVPGAEAQTEKLPASRPSDLPPDRPV